MDPPWLPSVDCDERPNQRERYSLRPRKQPTPEYEMAILLQNLEELPVPVLDSDEDGLLVPILLETDMSVCTGEPCQTVEKNSFRSNHMSEERSNRDGLQGGSICDQRSFSRYSHSLIYPVTVETSVQTPTAGEADPHVAIAFSECRGAKEPAPQEGNVLESGRVWRLLRQGNQRNRKRKLRKRLREGRRSTTHCSRNENAIRISNEKATDQRIATVLDRATRLNRKSRRRRKARNEVQQQNGIGTFA